MKSKWWYNYAGEDAPYRKGYQRITTSGNHIVAWNNPHQNGKKLLVELFLLKQAHIMKARIMMNVFVTTH